MRVGGFSGFSYLLASVTGGTRSGAAWPMNGQATCTKATCVACLSPPGTLWVPGFVAVAEGFSPTVPHDHVPRLAKR